MNKPNDSADGSNASRCSTAGWSEWLSALGFDEGPEACWTLYMECGDLQVWDWGTDLEWFICGNSLGDAGPRTIKDLQKLIEILDEPRQK